MKIVLLTSVTGNGGSAATAFHNAKVLRNLGEETTLFAPGDYWTQRGAAEGVAVRGELELRRGFRPLSFLRDFLRLRRFLVREGSAAVLVQKSPEQWLAFLVLKTIPRRITLGRLRGVVFPVKPSRFNRWIHNSMDLVLCSASTIARQYETLPGFEPAHVKVLLEGIDTDRFRPADAEYRKAVRTKLKLKQDAFYIGTAGRPAPVKGHDLLAQAFAKGCRGSSVGGEPVRLAIFSDESRRGPGSYSELGALCNELGIWQETDLRPGLLDDPRMIYGALDAYVIPSRGSEGSSRAALEARAMGLPVIASTAGVLPDLIRDGIDGRLVPCDDAEALAAALKDLLQRWPLGQTWGQAARVEMEAHFREQDYAARLLALLREAASS